MTGQKRVRFTHHELDLINRMAAIASAAPWGEGDYSDWSSRDSAPYDSLREKVHKLMDRPEKPRRYPEPEKIFRGALEGTRAFDADTGKELKPGDRFHRSRVEVAG